MKKGQGMDELSASMREQMDLAGRLAGQLAEAAGGFARTFLAEISGPRSRTCCDIPEPCWMPADLGEIGCAVCPGGRATLTLRVTNADFRARSFEVVAAGPDAGRISIQPANFTLGPKERRSVEVAFDAKLDEGVDCAELEALVWVFGCRNHYLRWTLDVGRREGRCCHQVEVRDQADYEHHWYDHFYCVRDCSGPQTRPRQPNG